MGRKFANNGAKNVYGNVVTLLFILGCFYFILLEFYFILSGS